MPARHLLAPFLGLAALLALAGCTNSPGPRSDGAVSQTTLNQASVPVQQAPVAAAAPGRGEQALDPRPLPPPPQAAPPEAPILDTKNRKTASVRTPSDDNLPKWVPVRGRLTVVDSSDLAENLGLVPKGSTKKSDERISVADKLEEEAAARRAAETAAPPRQVTGFSYSAGRFRNHR